MAIHNVLAVLRQASVGERTSLGKNTAIPNHQRNPQLEMCAESETLEYSVLNRKSVRKSSPQSSEVHAEEEAGRWEGPEMEEYLKETASYLPGTTGWIHIWTQRRGQHTLLHRLKPDKSPAHRRGSAHKLQSLTKRLHSQLIPAGDREIYFLQWSNAGYINLLPRRPPAQE